MGNNIQGTIPEYDGYGKDAFNQLSELYVGYNPLLSGTIPTTFGQLTKLEELILAGTDITGEVPKELCDMAVKTWQLIIYADCKKVVGCVKCMEDAQDYKTAYQNDNIKYDAFDYNDQKKVAYNDKKKVAYYDKKA